MEEKIKELIQEYNFILEAVEQDLSDDAEQRFCNSFLNGKRAAYLGIIEDLYWLLEGGKE